MKDFFGVEIEVGDLVVYGKADRNRPLNVGRVLEINPENGHWGEIVVKGVRNSKPGTLSGFQIGQRIVILPDSFEEGL